MGFLIIVFGTVTLLYVLKKKYMPKRIDVIDAHMPVVNLEEIEDRFNQNNCTICLSDLKSEQVHRIIKS